MLLSLSFIVLMLPLSHCDHKISGTRRAFTLQAQNESAKIAGTWKLSVETPHGLVSGPLEVKQDGQKLTGKYEAEHIGSMPVTGKLDGKKVSFSLEVPGANTSITLNGTVEGDKMSGQMGGGPDHGGAWTATRQQ